MRLGLVSRTESALEETARAVREAGGDALALPCDLRDSSAAASAVERTATSFGSLDTLINNAGVGAFWPLDSMDVERFDDVVSTNLRGAFACILAALPHMRLAGSGRIVNIASRAAQEGYPYLAAYSASKSGLVGLSEAVDAELEDENIRSHTLIVGSVKTPFHVAAAVTGADPGLVPQLMAGVEATAQHGHPDPVGMLEPEDVAEVVAMLLQLPDAMHVQPMVVRPSHDHGPADLGRMIRRGRAARKGESG
jgi:NAD(P)-dependent dehydrogenase (short-subunit alcohol dehydrogenase family)